MSSEHVRLSARSHWLAGTLALALVLPGSNQPVTRGEGTIEGRVRDPAGAPIAGAQVRVENTILGAVADTRGYYRIPSVTEGTVNLTAAFVGYRPLRITGVTVRTGQTTSRDVTLVQSAIEIGELEVTAAASQLVPRDAVSTGQAATYVDGVAVAPGSQGAGFVGVSSGAFEGASVTTGAASAEFGYALSGAMGLGGRDASGEEYHRIYENRYLDAVTNPLSTFSIDVDAASYTNVRSFLTAGTLPPADAVRIEEFINYFSYDYPDPTDGHPFSVTLEQAACPWNRDHNLLLVGLQGKHLDAEELPPSNLVFLIDVSGSMSSDDKLPLVKQAFRLMVPRLRPEDRVAVVVYAGAAGLVLPSTPGSQKSRILGALDRLSSGGSTAGSAGIQLAYNVAQENFLPRGNNRVILATDGDFNIGPSSESELVRMIEEKRQQGTFLTVLGFGTGNLRDAMMEQLADKGNGHYAYVDNLTEARRVFVNELSGTLYTIAKDVKLQIEFNPLRVKEYRLVGYENRVLAREDFDDDRKDAGDMGAGHSVTALYEITPADPAEMAERTSGELRYQNVSLTDKARKTGEWLTLKLRYKTPQGSTSRLLSRTLQDSETHRNPSDNLMFASAVAEFGLLLRNSEHRGDASAPRLIARARQATRWDPEGYRQEFVGLVERWRALKGLADD